eukprot:3021903-Amphidinium_carterae.1
MKDVAVIYYLAGAMPLRSLHGELHPTATRLQNQVHDHHSAKFAGSPHQCQEGIIRVPETPETVYP